MKHPLSFQRHRTPRYGRCWARHSDHGMRTRCDDASTRRIEMAGRSSILRIGKPARAALLASVLALVNADALTQGAPPITLPATPPPTACTVEPLSVDELRALYDAVLATSSADATAAATPSEAAAFALPAVANATR
jgi:hypothetical protein